MTKSDKTRREELQNLLSRRGAVTERKASKPEVEYASWLALTLALAASGWMGLYYLVTRIYPSTLTKVIFLALWGVALVGTAWPVLLAFNQRWGKGAAPARVWRQSSWVAAFGVLAAWLQMEPNRALTLSLAVIMAGAFGLIEVLLILREREEARREAKSEEDIDDTKGK